MKDKLSERRDEILEKVLKIARDILESIEKEKDPKIEIAIRSISNIEWDSMSDKIFLGDKFGVRNFLDLNKVRKFSQTVAVISRIVELLRSNVTSSLRDVYYNLLGPIEDLGIQTFNKQKESDKIIEDLEVILNSVREEFNVRADKKGYMVGPFVWVERYYTPEGEIREVEKDGTQQGMGGAGVPEIVEPGRFDIKEIDADFVLFIEKGAVFTRFVEDEFWKEHNCIIITGQGQPPRSVRRLLHRFRYEFNLPIYVLTDGDAWGYYIYSVIKRGSINLSYLSDRLATPDAKFLGVLTQDVDRFNLIKEVTLKLKDIDKKRIKELMEYPWFKNNKDWQKEFRNMLKKNIKIEMEAFSSKHFRYLTKEYVPMKLENKEFLC